MDTGRMRNLVCGTSASTTMSSAMLGGRFSVWNIPVKWTSPGAASVAVPPAARPIADGFSTWDSPLRTSALLAKATRMLTTTPAGLNHAKRLVLSTIGSGAAPMRHEPNRANENAASAAKPMTSCSPMEAACTRTLGQ
jgi:hypothetical protein